jgi:ADP-heptose:LPS heptosyltransferase
MNFDNQTIAVVIPKRLGDTLIATPSIRYLKTLFPKARLVAVCANAMSANTLTNNPWLDEIVVETDKATDAKLFNEAAKIFALRSSPEYFEENLKCYGDKAIRFPNLDDTCHKAEQELKFLAQQLGETVIPDNLRHYEIYPDAAEEQTIQNLLQSKGVDLEQHQLIGLHLGAYGVAKRKFYQFGKKYDGFHKTWGWNNYKQLAKTLLANNPNLKILLTGSKGEKPFIEKFCKEVPEAINLANQTTPLELAALMKKLRCFIVGDTGTAHVAYAVDCETIVLFGRTNVVEFGPYPADAPTSHVLQAASTADIPMQDVLAAVSKQLEENTVS